MPGRHFDKNIGNRQVTAQILVRLLFEIAVQNLNTAREIFAPMVLRELFSAKRCIRHALIAHELSIPVSRSEEALVRFG